LVGGTVDPENATTTYWIEYGPDESYGSSIPVSEDGEAGAGDDPSFVQQKLTGLAPGAEYHFRLVAANSAGPVAGNDQTFVTPTGDLGSAVGDVALPDNRRWEMVSPAAKNAADVWKAYVAASPDGQAVSYKSQGSFAGLPTAKGGNLADYIARRGTDSWVNKGLTPQGGLFCFVCGAVEMSADKSFVRFNWRERGTESPDKELELDPSQIESVTRQYLRNNQTDTFKRLPDSYGIDALSNAMSSDGSHIAVTTEESLTGEAPCDSGSTPCVYESLDHGFSWRLVSVLSGGAAEGRMIGMSEDGSRIYFRSGGNIYVRVDGTTTTQVAGDAATTIAAIEGPTGSRVLLRSSEALLPADEDSEVDLYVWDGSAPEGERLTLVSEGDIPGVEASFAFLGGFPSGVLAYREDQFNSHGLDGGFFAAGNQVLAGEPDAPGEKIYAWGADGGQPSLSYVATVNNLGDARISPDGRYLVLASTDRLTAYDNEGVQEIYRYDGETGRLACVSCDPQGRKQTRESRLSFISPQEGAFGIGHELRNVDDRGDVFFESLEGLVNHDSNGVSDVYEYEDGLPHLLSKGTGPHQSRFADASVSGDDVFILTDDQLVGWDVDRSYDIYDARIGGGLPEPPPPGIPCEGDSCQPVPNPPNDPTPASENFKGAGNVKPAAHKKKHCKKRHCKKHHHKKKHPGKKQSTKKNG
jgi:hypothetical protein